MAAVPLMYIDDAQQAAQAAPRQVERNRQRDRGRHHTTQKAFHTISPLRDRRVGNYRLAEDPFRFGRALAE